MRPRRLVGRLVLGAVTLVVVYVVATFVQVWWTARTDGARPADAVVVLGAAQYDGRPSAVLESRLGHALTLWQDEVAPLVVVTGGGAPGDTSTEASSGSTWLRERGIPDDRLRLEVQGRTTYASLLATRRFLAEEGATRVVLVSDGWHLARSVAIAREVGLDATGSPAPDSPYSTAGALRQMVRETGGLAVGRLVGFGRLERLTS